MRDRFHHNRCLTIGQWVGMGHQSSTEDRADDPAKAPPALRPVPAAVPATGPVNRRRADALYSAMAGSIRTP